MMIKESKKQFLNLAGEEISLFVWKSNGVVGEQAILEVYTVTPATLLLKEHNQERVVV